MWPRGRWEDIQSCLNISSSFSLSGEKLVTFFLYTVLNCSQHKHSQHRGSFQTISEDEACSTKSRCRDLFYGVKVSGWVSTDLRMFVLWRSWHNVKHGSVSRRSLKGVTLSWNETLCVKTLTMNSCPLCDTLLLICSVFRDNRQFCHKWSYPKFPRQKTESNSKILNQVNEIKLVIQCN